METFSVEFVWKAGSLLVLGLSAFGSVRYGLNGLRKDITQIRSDVGKLLPLGERLAVVEQQIEDDRGWLTRLSDLVERRLNVREDS